MNRFHPQRHAHMRSCFVMCCLFLLAGIDASTPLSAQEQKAIDWSPLQFLLGEWFGGGGGKGPGQGTGTFSFSLDLQNAVIVRKNHSDYPATKDRPAYAHDDLMVIYQEADQSLQAAYFDNEGHTIHYNVQAFKDSVIFLSDLKPLLPRFRLAYIETATGKLKLIFDIAPPNKPEVFSRYIEALADRKK